MQNVQSTSEAGPLFASKLPSKYPQNYHPARCGLSATNFVARRVNYPPFAIFDEDKLQKQVTCVTFEIVNKFVDSNFQKGKIGEKKADTPSPFLYLNLFCTCNL